MTPTSAPDASVVLLTRNRPSMLAQALQSVLGQRGVDLEVLVVDNGSTSPDALVVPGIDDPRVRVLEQGANRRVADARNAGLEAARGTWVGYLDDDDLWGPDKVRHQIDVGEGSGRSWVYTGNVDVDVDLRVLRGGPPHPPERVVASLAGRNEVPGGSSGVLARRSVLLELGGMDPQFQYVADWDLWLRLADHGMPARSSEPDLAYRIHGSNMSRQVETLLHEIDLLESKFPPDGAGVDRASFIRDIATAECLTGHRRAATRNYLAAIRGGDRRARLVVGSVLLPDRVQRDLRRRRSDPAWLAGADAWLRPLRATGVARS